MVEPSPNRNRWIIAGVIGCSALCVCAAIVAGGWYFLLGPSASPARVTPPVAQLTQIVPSPTATIVFRSDLITPTPLPTFTAVIPSPQPPAPTPRPPQPSPTPGAPRGKVVFSVERGDRPEDKFLWSMNADGTGAKQILERASSPALSPDGNQIAYYHWNDGIYVANADGSNTKKIVGETNAKSIAWSYDGKWIAFASQTTKNIDAVLPDGTGRRTIVTGGDMPTWSPDESQIALSTCRGSLCGIFRANSGGGFEPVLVTGDAGGNPVWSPDGKKILYQVEANDVKQLFVVNIDGTGRKQLAFGSAPHVDGQWSSDGNYIFYRSTEAGSWGIWRMNADGAKPIKLIGDVPPVDWPIEKLAVMTLTK